MPSEDIIEIPVEEVEAPKELTPRQLKERENLVAQLSDGTQKTLRAKVAWTMSVYPETRDADITLQKTLWKEFHRDLYDGGDNVTVEALYKLPKLTSAARDRAKIQNTFGLFKAKKHIQEARGRLADEAWEREVTERDSSNAIMVYADESGKTDANLVVGSMWVLDGFGHAAFSAQIDAWMKTVGLSEMHFSEIKQRTIASYLRICEFIVPHLTYLSFRGLHVPRIGVSSNEDAYRDLFFYLLADGVGHQHESGRAVLPRRLFFYKDNEETGRDKLMLANIEERLQTASATRFNNRLWIEAMEAPSSKKNKFLQLADLFTGSINRKLNQPPDGTNPKDQFADAFLRAIRFDTTSDLAVLTAL